MATPKHPQIKTLEQNPNNHTQAGLRELEDSMRQVGYTEPMVAAADGTLLAGNARAEVAADVLPVEPIYVHSDGSQPIIHVRDDIPDAGDPRAKRVILGSNRIAQLNFNPNTAILLDMLAELKEEAGGIRGTGYNESDVVTLLQNLEKTSYTPDGQPVIGAVNVTEDQVAAKKDELESQFAGETEYVECTCPHCGKDFFLSKKDVR